MGSGAGVVCARSRRALPRSASASASPAPRGDLRAQSVRSRAPVGGGLPWPRRARAARRRARARRSGSRRNASNCPRHRHGQAGAVTRLEREEDALPTLLSPELRDLALDPDRRQARKPPGDTAIERGDAVDLAVAILLGRDFHPRWAMVDGRSRRDLPQGRGTSAPHRPGGRRSLSANYWRDGASSLGSSSPLGRPRCAPAAPPGEPDSRPRSARAAASPRCARARTGRFGDLWHGQRWLIRPFKDEPCLRKLENRATELSGPRSSRPRAG